MISSRCDCAPTAGMFNPSECVTRRNKMTTHQRKVEVFTAGCSLCDEAVALVQQLACGSCEVTVQETHDATVASKARGYGVHRVPAVVIDGKLASCCFGTGPQEQTLRAAGLGVAL